MCLVVRASKKLMDLLGQHTKAESRGVSKTQTACLSFTKLQGYMADFMYKRLKRNAYRYFQITSNGFHTV